MKLKPCPFCEQRSPVHRGIDNDGFYCDFVYCDNCNGNDSGDLDIWQDRPAIDDVAEEIND